MVVPTKLQIDNGTFKVINGTWHKLCTGPAHDEPEYLPATTKYFYVHKSGKLKGKLVARCRLCTNWVKLKSPGSHHGWVPVEKVHPYYTEVVNRIGAAELHRRSGLSMGHIRAVINRQQTYVKKAQLRRLMLELTSVRRKREFSANKSSKWRTERRNNRGLEICTGCGTPKSNFTTGCISCRNRLYDMMRSGKITDKEFEKKRKELDG